MAGYPYQTTDHDASISVERDEHLVVIEVAAGSCVTVQLPLNVDEARGLLGALSTAINEADQ
jgi:ArsR family metal-binding transcriptional regulator